MNIKYLKLFRKRFSIHLYKDLFLLKDKDTGYVQYCSHYNECVFHMFNLGLSSRIFLKWYRRKEKRFNLHSEKIWKEYKEKYK